MVGNADAMRSSAPASGSVIGCACARWLVVSIDDALYRGSARESQCRLARSPIFPRALPINGARAHVSIGFSARTIGACRCAPSPVMLLSHGGAESDEHRMAPGRGDARGPREDERPQGLYGLAHRSLWLGQVDDRRRPREAALGAGRP